VRSHRLIAVLGLIFVSIFAYTSNGVSSEHKQGTLEDALGEIRSKVKSARLNVDPNALKSAAEKFDTHKYDDSRWKEQAVVKWPDQSARQAVGSQIFFPPDVEELESSPHTEDQLKRLDYLWQFAIAAKYEDPLGKYYLARKLKEILVYRVNQEQPEFLDQLYQEAFSIFEKCTDRPHVCSILGYNHCGYDKIPSYYDCNPQERIRLYGLASADPRNQFAILKAQDAKYPEMIEFAKKTNYGPAYIAASELTQDQELKLDALKAAQACGYKPSLVELGFYYEDQENVEKAINFYTKAGEEGVTEGYIQAGKCLVGDVALDKLKDDLTEEDIQQAITYFTYAGNLHDPSGWYCLYKLYSKLISTEKYLTKKEYYKAGLVQAFDNGARLGHEDLCYKLLNFSNKEHDVVPFSDIFLDELKEFI